LVDVSKLAAVEQKSRRGSGVESGPAQQSTKLAHAVGQSLQARFETRRTRSNEAAKILRAGGIMMHLAEGAVGTKRAYAS
jgi:hypothetical protein